MSFFSNSTRWIARVAARFNTSHSPTNPEQPTDTADAEAIEHADRQQRLLEWREEARAAGPFPSELYDVLDEDMQFEFRRLVGQTVIEHYGRDFVDDENYEEVLGVASDVVWNRWRGVFQLRAEGVRAAAAGMDRATAERIVTERAYRYRHIEGCDGDYRVCPGCGNEMVDDYAADSVRSQKQREHDAAVWVIQSAGGDVTQLQARAVAEPVYPQLREGYELPDWASSAGLSLEDTLGVLRAGSEVYHDDDMTRFYDNPNRDTPVIPTTARDSRPVAMPWLHVNEPGQRTPHTTTTNLDGPPSSPPGSTQAATTDLIERIDQLTTPPASSSDDREQQPPASTRDVAFGWVPFGFTGTEHDPATVLATAAGVDALEQARASMSHYRTGRPASADPGPGVSAGWENDQRNQALGDRDRTDGLG